jgi:hypothetical protein
VLSRLVVLRDLFCVRIFETAIKSPYLEVCTDLRNVPLNGNVQTESFMSNSEWITSELLPGQCVNMRGVCGRNADC